MNKKLYTIATGSRLGGHCTTVHVSVDQLVQELNSTLASDEAMIRHIIEEYNETAETLGRPRFEGSVEDFDFKFIVENDPRLDIGGWGWAFDHVNARGQEDHSYLNISVHDWNGTYFETEG